MMFLALLLSTQLQAQTPLVEKKTFTLASYTTETGKTIAPVKVGYETYGTLNDAKDNAILISHFYSGNSHAAGKYAEADPYPGYWDSIIGPGKAIDTNKYFVISSDTIVNIAPLNPQVITTGPASINPKTKKPYGMSFPLVGVRDFVNVQRELVKSLGITQLHAAIGASGGAAQVMDYAAAYPAEVKNVVSVIGPGLSMPPYVIQLLNMWAMPIRMDRHWNGGNYYGKKQQPTQGVQESMKFVILSAVYHDWVEKTFGANLATDHKLPLANLEHLFTVEAGFVAMGKLRGAAIDANSFLYTARAIQTFNVEELAKNIQAKTLFIPATTDLIFPPEVSYRAMKKLCDLGKHAEAIELKGTGGHLDGLFVIAQAQDKIRSFLSGKTARKCGEKI
ncbi:MAG: homoserine O-acetyltransferase [Bacteriovoracia bacterium]